MKKDNLIKALNNLKKNPPDETVAKFTIEDKVVEGEGWVRVRCPQGTLAIWVQNGVAYQIMDTSDPDLKWSCTKENIEYAIELCGGLELE